jgi:thioesterase domain-containing protein
MSAAPAGLTADRLERYLHEHIPISRALGVRVVAAGADVVRLGAPLEPNLNHRQTAFGGSLSAVAILAAWSWLYLRLGGPDFGGRIVIQNHSVEYLAPAEGDFVATCAAPGDELWTRFERALERRGRARVTLDEEVCVGGLHLASCRGRYVALRAGRE